MNIEIFYHMYCINDCVNRFAKTYNKIYNSGLIELCNSVNVVLVGDVDVDRYTTQIGHYKKVKTTCHSSDTFGEMNTIKAIYDFCQNNSDSYVLYLHSKGASRGSNPNVTAWVDYMEYFLIEKHQTCFEKLKEYDAVGVEYHETPKKHYSGNFWWANSSYIKRHKTFDQGLQTSSITDPRWYCEFWLLDNICKPCNLHSSGIDLYGAKYEETNYKL